MTSLHDMPDASPRLIARLRLLLSVQEANCALARALIERMHASGRVAVARSPVAAVVADEGFREAEQAVMDARLELASRQLALAAFDVFGVGS